MGIIGALAGRRKWALSRLEPASTSGARRRRIARWHDPGAHRRRKASGPVKRAVSIGVVSGPERGHAGTAAEWILIDITSARRKGRSLRIVGL